MQAQPPPGISGRASAVRLSDDDSSSSSSRFEIEGLVSGFGVARRVPGLRLRCRDALNATFTDGTLADLVNGALVEIEGSLANGRLVASRIEFKSNGRSSGGSSGDDGFEVKGTIDSFVSLAQFTVRNTRIDASGTGVLFEGGTAGALSQGVCVEIKGTPSTDSQGTVIHATEVKSTTTVFDSPGGGLPLAWGVRRYRHGEIATRQSSRVARSGGSASIRTAPDARAPD
ncbi:MAG: DUF5666 domain-containing protein [Burkholderiaceae bacterium]